MALNNQQFLQSIRPDMKLTKSFFRSVYCREMDAPGFADQAVAALGAAGCSHAREYYDSWVREYEAEDDAVMKRVSEWYRNELRKKWVAEERKVNKERTEKLNIQNLTKNKLTELCQKLLSEGIITEPEQFATAVMRDF